MTATCIACGATPAQNSAPLRHVGKLYVCSNNGECTDKLVAIVRAES